MERIEAVCRERGLTHKAWSRAAGFADNYIAMATRRAREDPAYELPEKAAAALARVAQVSPEWLRRGTGTSEISETQPDEAQRARPADYTQTTDLDYAVLEAWRRTDYSPDVVVSLQRLIGAGRGHLPREREEVILVAGRWLRAVAKLVREGRPVTWESVASATALLTDG